MSGDETFYGTVAECPDCLADIQFPDRQVDAPEHPEIQITSSVPPKEEAPREATPMHPSPPIPGIRRDGILGARKSDSLSLGWNGLDDWRKAENLSDKWWLSVDGRVSGTMSLRGAMVMSERHLISEIYIVHEIHGGIENEWIHISSPLSHDSPYCSQIRDVLERIQAIKREVDRYKLRKDSYYCSRCNRWTKPFFEYVDLPGPGIAISNDHGITLFRQTHSTEERARCNSCGTQVFLSGDDNLQSATIKLQWNQERLDCLQRKEARCYELHKLSKKRPILATFLRLLYGVKRIKTGA